jgi:hypothetical protein
MSKRRKGYPFDRRENRGIRIVRGDKQLEEKLGRNDLCPCGSGKLFNRCCLATLWGRVSLRELRWQSILHVLLASDTFDRYGPQTMEYPNLIMSHR